MTDAVGHIPEIGVAVDDEAEQPSVQVLAPLTGKNGVLLRMCMFDMQKARWISGSGVTTSASGRPSATPPPPTYQVRL